MDHIDQFSSMFKRAEKTPFSYDAPSLERIVLVTDNDKLDKSMVAGNAEHPVGSVAIKELHKDGKMYGWAAAIKAREDDGKGNGWYWYETLSLTDGRKPVAASLGANMCVGCHSTGEDFIRIGKIE